MNLRSTVNKKGRYVTEIIHFRDGAKLTFDSIDTETFRQGEFTKFELKDGRMILVNTANVNLIEVFKEENI